MARNDREQEMAALADTATGKVERPMSSSRWAVPNRVELDVGGDQLLWGWDDGLRWVGEDAVPGLLERFVGLTDASPKGIAGFARDYGVLAICAHGLPASHHPDAAPARAALTLPDASLWPWGCDPLDAGGRTYREPLAAWRRFAGEALEVALAVARLQADGPFHAATDRLAEAMKVHEVLNDWIAIGRVRPGGVLHLSDGGRELKLIPTFGGDGLFGALALRLLLAAMGVKGLAICANCSELFAPDRKQRRGERSWCPRGECQRAKLNLASADYRRRRAGQLDGPASALKRPR